jgi:hypothetical protein
MRLSAKRDDPGFDAKAVPFAAIEFNGVRQSPKVTGRAIITADEAAGRIDYVRYDLATGRPIMLGDRLAEGTAFGVVRIILGGACCSAA